MRICYFVLSGRSYSNSLSIKAHRNVGFIFLKIENYVLKDNNFLLK